VTIEVEIDGRRRQVTLRRQGSRWVAALDGREIAVSVVERGDHWSMLVNPAEAGLHDLSRISSEVESGFSRISREEVESGSSRISREVESGSSRISREVESGFSRISREVESGFSRISYEVSFEAGANGDLIVHVNGVAVPVTIVDRRRRRAGSGEAGSDTQPRTIVAPMPGRIVRVLVQPGEAVEARQGLVVVEAMKMENELRAPRSGTVAEVRVREGASVEANAVLVVLR
jgi:biotin carboxyl carrier protein